MRAPVVLLLLITAQTGWGSSASAQVPPASAVRQLTLIPTAFQELDVLRFNTGEKAVLGDSTMSAVYDKKVPARGNTYLNFHVDVASETGPLVLRGESIRLMKEGKAGETTTAVARGAKGKPALKPVEVIVYTPFDWFIDTGSQVRGDSLKIDNKALVQFTIEVPQGGFDDLTLFILSQRIGTVREIRELITNDQDRSRVPGRR